MNSPSLPGPPLPRLPAKTQPLLQQGLGSPSPNCARHGSLFSFPTPSRETLFIDLQVISHWHFSLTIHQQYPSIKWTFVFPFPTGLVGVGKRYCGKAFSSSSWKKFQDSIGVRDSLGSLDGGVRNWDSVISAIQYLCGSARRLVCLCLHGPRGLGYKGGVSSQY